MKKSLITLGLMLSLSAPLFADAYEDRAKIMENQKDSMKVLSGMAKGEVPFDADVANTLLNGIAEGAKVLPTLFPEGSTNEKSEASPKIWEDPAGFEAALNQFIGDTTAATETPVTDEFDLGERLGMFGKNCKSCHEDYRIKKE